MVDQHSVDVVVSVLVASIVAVGVVTAVQMFAAGESVSGGAASMPPVMRVVGPVFMSLVIASVVGGVYLYARKQFFAPSQDAAQQNAADSADAGTAGPASGDGSPVDAGPTDEADAEPKDEADAEPTGEADADQSGQSTTHGVLDVLPEDEYRILKPVVESPGLTQIEIRDRSGYSKSKVSQTISGLEERGLLYREAQGRTYRVYPAEDLDGSG